MNSEEKKQVGKEQAKATNSNKENLFSLNESSIFLPSCMVTMLGGYQSKKDNGKWIDQISLSDAEGNPFTVKHSFKDLDQELKRGDIIDCFFSPYVMAGVNDRIKKPQLNMSPSELIFYKKPNGENVKF